MKLKDDMYLNVKIHLKRKFVIITVNLVLTSGLSVLPLDNKQIGTLLTINFHSQNAVFIEE